MSQQVKNILQLAGLIILLLTIVILSFILVLPAHTLKSKPLVLFEKFKYHGINDKKR